MTTPRRRKPSGGRKTMHPDALRRLMGEMGFSFTTAQRSDSIDFRDVAVWTAREALEGAYAAGFAAGKMAAKRVPKRRVSRA